MTEELTLKIEGALIFQYDSDNTEERLLKLADDFVDMAIEWAEARDAELSMYVGLDRNIHSTWSIDEDEDEFSYAGGLMTDEDYAEVGTRWTLTTNDEE